MQDKELIVARGVCSCTWRMLRKEDYLEDLQKVNNSELIVAPSKSTALSESTMDKQNENFFLVSHLLIITCK